MNNISGLQATGEMNEQWYVLRSKPNKEDHLWRELLAHGFEVFYPIMRVQPVNPRSRKVRPYFPGYLFVRVDLESVGVTTLSWMPHSRGVVTFDAQPPAVADGLIHAIRRRVEQINASGGELLESLHHGDAVTIQHGPFEGFEAIFDAKVSGSERVRVLLKLLKGQQMPVVLPPGQVRKKKQK